MWDFERGEDYTEEWLANEIPRRTDDPAFSETDLEICRAQELRECRTEEERQEVIERYGW